MTYKFNPTQHSTKIKTGLLKAKQVGKKLGRPKGGKIKGEDEVISLYILRKKDMPNCRNFNKFTHKNIVAIVGVSKGTVQKIINKYKKENV